MQKLNIWKSSWIISVNFYSKSKTYMPEFRDYDLNDLYVIHNSLCFNLSLRYNLNSRHL